jgi:hypothetical protein
MRFFFATLNRFRVQNLNAFERTILNSKPTTLIAIATPLMLSPPSLMCFGYQP